MSLLVEKFCLRWNNRTVVYGSSDTAQNTVLTRCHLTAGLYKNEVFYLANNTSYICSRHNEIFHYVLRYLRCSLDFVDSRVNYGGRLQSNGSWSGILSLLDRHRVDFLPHIFSNTNGRASVVDFETLIPAKEHITIVSYPKVVAIVEGPWNIFKSFSVTIWLLIAGFYLLYSLLNWRSYSLFYRASSKARFTILDLFTSMIDIFALLLGQGTVHLSCQNNNNSKNPAKNRFHVLQNPLIFWIVFSLVIRNLFANDITAVLLSRGTFRLDTFAQLSQLSKSEKILVVERSSAFYFVKEKFPGLMDKIETIAFEDSNSVETLKKVVQGQCVLITTRDFGEMIQRYYLTFEFHVSKEGFYSTLGNFAIGHKLDAVNKRRLNRLWKNIYEYGLEKKIDKTIFMSNLQASFRQNQTGIGQLNRDSFEHLNSQSQYSSSSVMTFVYIFLIGIAFSVFAFLLEYLGSWCLKRETVLSQTEFYDKQFVAV